MAKMTRILKSHGIDYRVDGNKIFALEEFTQFSMISGKMLFSGCRWIDVSDFTIDQLYSWLGY